MQSLVVNAFGGPGAGKTTAAWNIAAELKKKGYVVEYVPEYAKELVWEGNIDLLNGSIINQAHLLREQNHRIERLIGKAEIIITDSPILLNIIYLREKHFAYIDKVLELHNKYSNFNFVVERGDRFEKEGRIHSLESSIEKDKEILSFLDDKKIYYGIYTHDNIDVLVNNIEKSYLNLNYDIEEKIPFGTGDGYIRFTKDKEVEIYQNGSSLYMAESDFYADLHKMDYQIALAAEKRKPKEEVTKSKKKAAR